ncbi:hypothetical protein TPHA_0O00500 [Tetrapisispora phaffii CBS 4417]|uniref:Uncharacterized protein n=1 Tax=Tetrapisispora phaffii (strain ATCC 24235 / CBS 4417 / NBRC 1672 / NRRL Y-8282 / UCD 70-5) TaxID=1071381 RepID=G8C1J2_TETPH|nr:hypothetical protein TPHA_0O00500 [Tetrapisispora phaffii CBS 4417]CCE66020.1 hypothetical protein TPHA_0O00500 [Tetrapisispora phaffii CBS 4417]
MSQTKDSKFRQLLRSLKRNNKSKEPRDSDKITFNIREKLRHIKFRIHNKKSSKSHLKTEKKFIKPLNSNHINTVKPCLPTFDTHLIIIDSPLEMTTLDPGKRVGDTVLENKCIQPEFSDFEKCLDERFRLHGVRKHAVINTNLPETKKNNSNIINIKQSRTNRNDIEVLSGTIPHNKLVKNNFIRGATNSLQETEEVSECSIESRNMHPSVNELISLIDNEYDYYNSLPRTLLIKPDMPTSDNILSLDNTLISEYSLCY